MLRRTLPYVAVLVLLGVAIASSASHRWPVVDSEYLDAFPPLAAGEEAILFGGDTMLGGSTPVREKFKQEGRDWMSRRLAPTLESAQATAFVVNLEVPITKARKKGKGVGKWHYSMRPRMVDGLQAAGVTHASLANNHILDRRRKGMEDTWKHLDAAGIPHFGTGETLAAAMEPAVIEVGGLRVAVLGGMQPWKRRRDADWGATAERSGVLFFDKENIGPAVAAAKARSDYVVAFPHWGENYENVKKPMRRIADRLIEAGADAIVGHHNHAALGYQVRDGVPILWGLGNFLFGTQGRFGHDKMQPGYGLLARMVFAEGEMDRIELIPMRINNRLQDYQPKPCGRLEAKQVMRLMAKDDSFAIDESGVGVIRVR